MSLEEKGQHFDELYGAFSALLSDYIRDAETHGPRYWAVIGTARKLLVEMRDDRGAS